MAMKKYRLKEGFKHSVRLDGHKFKTITLEPGEEVELTPEQAIAWADKFEPVGHAGESVDVAAKKAPRRGRGRSASAGK